jgi:hypothetical protein
MPAGSTYTKIASTTVGTAAASVTLSSIPSTYTDLVLVVNGSATSNNTAYMQFNGDTSTNYSATQIYSTGSAAGTNRQTSSNFMWLGEFYTNSTLIVQIPNYANTTTFKNELCRTSTPSAYLHAIVGLWRSTAAINSITATMTSTTYASGTTFNLYGIAAA